MSSNPEAKRLIEKAKLLSDELAQAKQNLAAHPGHNAALRVQRIQKLREQVQNQIKPYLIASGAVAPIREN